MMMMRGGRGAPVMGGAAMMGLSCLVCWLGMAKAQEMDLPPGLFTVEPSPWPVKVQQPDGDDVELFVRGSPEATGIWLETAEEYTVVEEGPNEVGQVWYSYAQLNATTGDVEAIPECHPPKCTSATLEEKHVPKHVILNVSRSVRIGRCGGPCKTTRKHQTAAIDLHPILRERKRLTTEHENDPTNRALRRRLATPATMKNLVVLLKFADHGNRNLPTVGDITKLMGGVNQGNVQDIAPTGSIYDVYYQNSYGQFNLESTVYEWVPLPYNEAYYAGGNSGFTGKVSEAIKVALDYLSQRHNLAQFDSTGDGYIDAITILHSGYGAEWNGNPNAIWSHKWALQGGGHTVQGKRVYDYHISPALWSTSGSDIGRIGVIAHETGHFLGLPDLYDGSGGQGIGSWGLMGNSWGFDGSQLHPPYLSPWSKIFLGWVTPTVITTGRHDLLPSYTHNKIFKVQQGYRNQEYLLIENRVKGGLEVRNPGNGMLVWHIDEYASDTEEGYPGNGWPNKHYRVAVVQADGDFDLEKGYNRGDATDLFTVGASVGGSGLPSICRYDQQSCPHVIKDISYSGTTLSFTLNQGAPVTPMPTAAPTRAPTFAPTPENGQTLSTTFINDNYRNAGMMFDIEATSGKTLTVFGISVNIDLTTDVIAHVYSISGSHLDNLKYSDKWIKQGEVKVRGAGLGQKTLVTGFKHFSVPHGSKTGVYVTLESDNMVYSAGTFSNTVDAQDDSIILYQGSSISKGKSMDSRLLDGQRFFQDNYTPRKPHVALSYVVESLCNGKASPCNEGGNCCSGTCAKTRRRRKPRRRRRRRPALSDTSPARLLESDEDEYYEDEEDDENLPQFTAAAGTCT